MENKKYKYIDKYRIDINILIGKTFYSKVYQGEDIKTNKIVAIKLIDLKYISDNYIFNNLYNQLTNLKTIQSNYLIEIYDIFFSKSYLYIIEQYCKSGNFELFL